MRPGASPPSSAIASSREDTSSTGTSSLTSRASRSRSSAEGAITITTSGQSRHRPRHPVAPHPVRFMDRIPPSERHSRPFPRSQTTSRLSLAMSRNFPGPRISNGACGLPTFRPTSPQVAQSRSLWRHRLLPSVDRRRAKPSREPCPTSPQPGVLTSAPGPNLGRNPRCLRLDAEPCSGARPRLCS